MQKTTFVLVCFVLVTVSAVAEEQLPPEFVPAHTNENYLRMPATYAPHYVLEAPQPIKPSRSTTHVVEEEMMIDNESLQVSHEPNPNEEVRVKPHEKVAKHFLHADKMPRPVAIPNANRVPVWKMPYSYGHFGASHNRQWSFHNGHQQTYSQWTLR